jgi:hypothetical protein
MVAKSVSHPTVDDLGLVASTRCNLRVVVSPIPPLSIRPRDIRPFQRTPTASRLLFPARRPQTPKLRRRYSANPHFVSLCLKAQSLLLQHHYHRDTLHRHHTPLSFPPTVCLLFCRCCCFRWIFVFSCTLLPLICN